MWALWYRLQYALDDSRADKEYGNWFTRFWCRWNNHACGVVWYSSGYEPGMYCKRCGENLG